MTEKKFESRLLKVKSDFYRLTSSKDIEDHLTILQSRLENLICDLASENGERSLKELLDRELPIIQHHLDHQNGQFLSLSLLCHAQEKLSLSDFVFDLFRFHLVPGQSQYPSAFHNITFSPVEYGRPLYLAHAVIMIRNERQFDLIESNLPFFLQALESGIKNYPFAQSIMSRQLSIPDQKSHQTYENLIRVIERFPFQAELILSEASLFNVLSSENFRSLRNPKKLASIICTLAILRKSVRESPRLYDSQPRILFRLIPMQLKLTFGEKNTLGLCMVISHLDTYQLFNEGCVLQAVRAYLVDAQTVKGSFVSYKHPQDFSHGMYIELEKKKGEPFTLEELKYLKKHLARSLEASVEDVVPSIFMNSNEEEILKNIIILRNELESIDDLTQVMITFERQTFSHLTFVIILLRILEKDNVPLQEKFLRLGDKWEFIPERTRIVSTENDEVTKEAHVFRLRLKKSRAFIRTDSSVNLLQARQHVVEFLRERIGPIRDYTGSLIDLQNVMFWQFKEKYRESAQKYPNIVEDFFYTMSPADVKITLPLSAIEMLFEHCSELLEIFPESPEHYIVKKSENDDFAFAMLRIKSSFTNFLDQKVRMNETLSPSLISNKIQVGEQTYIGYIYRGEDTHKRFVFFQQIQSAILSCVQEDQGAQVLRLGIQAFPTSLDPRCTLSTAASYSFKLLFDGLMRLNAEGEPVCAVAESYTLSQDRKTYTFHLRESYWNNGDPVTADDFAYSWGKILSPSFSTPYVHLLYPIKNAKAVKKGEKPLESLGVYAKDPRTLVVELEYPVSHFLQYVTSSLFFPVNRKIDRLHPDWPYRSMQEYVCNGPFTLEKVIPGQMLQFEKNPNYWDQQFIRLANINIVFNNINTIFHKYQKGEIHWLGAPFTSWEKRFLNCQEDKKSFSFSTLNWIIVNTESGPFTNKKLRKALKYALNLEELVAELSIEAKPAHSPLPPLFSYIEQNSITGNPEKARELFDEALKEMNITERELPKLTLIHANEMADIRGNMLKKMQAQVKAALGVDLHVEQMPWSLAWKKNVQGDFQLIVTSWKFLSNLPFLLLDSFDSMEDLKMFRWSNENYKKMLDSAHQEEDPTLQKEKVAAVVRVLEDEAPVIPLYYDEEFYIKNERLKGVVIDSRIGFIDFKNAYFKSVKPDMEQLVKWI
jgi:oligopeptide transport system substrate-binding protein